MLVLALSLAPLVVRSAPESCEVRVTTETLADQGRLTQTGLTSAPAHPLRASFYDMPASGNFSRDLVEFLYDPESGRPTTPLARYRWSLANLQILFGNIFKILFYGSDDTLATPNGYRPLEQVPVLRAFRELTESHLSDFGRTVAHTVKGRVFVDLGAGHPDFSLLPRALAETWGAHSYVSVDRSAHPHARTSEFARSGFRSHFLREDILDFLLKLQRPGPIFFFIEGIEYRPANLEQLQDTVEYLKRVLQELRRVTEPGDGLFIGRVVSFVHAREDLPEHYMYPNLDPHDFGFEQAGILPLQSHFAFMPADASVNPTYTLWVRQPD